MSTQEKKGNFFIVENLSSKVRNIYSRANKMYESLRQTADGEVSTFKAISIYSSVGFENVIAPAVVIRGIGANLVATDHAKSSEGLTANEAPYKGFGLVMSMQEKTLAEATKIMREVFKQFESKNFSQAILVEAGNSVKVYIKTDDKPHKIYSTIMVEATKKCPTIEMNINLA